MPLWTTIDETATLSPDRPDSNSVSDFDGDERRLWRNGRGSVTVLFCLLLCLTAGQALFLRPVMRTGFRFVAPTLVAVEEQNFLSVFRLHRFSSFLCSKKAATFWVGWLTPTSTHTASLPIPGPEHWSNLSKGTYRAVQRFRSLFRNERRAWAASHPLRSGVPAGGRLNLLWPPMTAAEYIVTSFVPTPAKTGVFHRIRHLHPNQGAASSSKLPAKLCASHHSSIVQLPNTVGDAIKRTTIVVPAKGFNLYVGSSRVISRIPLSSLTNAVSSAVESTRIWSAMSSAQSPKTISMPMPMATTNITTNIAMFRGFHQAQNFSAFVRTSNVMAGCFSFQNKSSRLSARTPTISVYVPMSLHIRQNLRLVSSSGFILASSWTADDYERADSIIKKVNRYMYIALLVVLVIRVIVWTQRDK